MELYFTESENISKNEATFDAFESRHILKTMRKQSGDLIQFTDGKGYLYQGRIIATQPVLRAAFSSTDRKFWPVPEKSALGIGFIRPARMDYLIEKATELGISHFYLFPSRYSNYQTDNKGRWEKISRQAMKQSNRVYLPEIKIISNFKNVIFRNGRDFIQIYRGTKYRAAILRFIIREYRSAEERHYLLARS